MVDDPWLHVRRDAMLGELARIEHRFDDAVGHIGRAAETSGRLGFLQTHAYQVSSLGRAQCQAGDYPAGAATLRLAVEKAEATGDLRLAALARVHLGRVLRALGEDAEARAALESAAAWHRAAGGGEQAALGECLLAAMDAAQERLEAILEAAQRDGDAHVEVFALDALARIASGGRRRHPGTGAPRDGGPADGRRLALHHAARSRRALVEHDEAEQARDHEGDADHLAVVDHLRQQQVGPHDGEGGLCHLGDPDRADLDRLLREDHQPLGGHAAGEREDEHVRPSAAAEPGDVAVRDRQREHGHGRDRADRRHEDGDVHLPAEVPRRRHVRDEEQHRDHAEHVALQGGVAVGRRAEEHERHAAEGDEREDERPRVDALAEQPRADRHDEERRQGSDERGVGDAVVRRAREEHGEVEAEEDAGDQRLSQVGARDPPARAPDVDVPDDADGDQPPERDQHARRLGALDQRGAERERDDHPDDREHAERLRGQRAQPGRTRGGSVGQDRGHARQRANANRGRGVARGVTPLHVHRVEDEIFHVLEGEVRFQVADEELRVRAGETLLAPKGVRHTYLVESSASLPEPSPMTPEQRDALVAAGREHGLDVVGPRMR